MGKLQQDEIKWVLSVQSSEAQQEIHKLTQETKALTKEQRSYQKQMQDLVAQGKKNTEEYRNLEEEYKRLGEKIKSNEEAQAELTNKLDLSAMSMNQLKKRAKELREQLNATARADNPKAWDEQRAQLQAVEAQMNSLRGGGASLANSLSAIPGPAGMAVSSLQSVGASLKALALNPIIMAVVAAFMLLKTAIEGSDEGRTKLEGWFNAMKSVFDSLKRIVTEFGKLLYSVVTFDMDGIKQHIAAIGDIGASVTENAQAAYEAALAEDALNDAIERNNDITEVNKSRISELRLITKDTTQSIEDRIAANKELMALEEDNYKRQLANVNGQYRVFVLKNKNLIDAMKRNNAAQFAEVERYMAMVNEGTELTYQQRIELANLVNQITATLDAGTEEEKAKFRAFFTDLSKMQKEYNDGRRRDVTTDAEIRKSAAAEAKAQAQQAKQNAIKRLEDEATAELNALKKRYADKLITQAEYERQSEALALKQLERKKALSVLDQSERLNVESQLLDAQIRANEKQIKAKEEEDKKELESLKKRLEDANRIVERAYADRFAELQRQSAAGAITEEEFQARKLLLDREIAEERLQINANYQEALMSSNIQTETLRVEAVQAANDAIAKSETDLQNKRIEIMRRTEFAARDLRKSLGLQTAADELKLQQETITASAEARRVLMLGENYRTRELSKAEQAKKLALDEAEKMALLRSETDYENKKITLKRQYGLASIAEQLQVQLDGLAEQHRRGLISEQEYEIAKQELRLQKATEVQMQLTTLIGNAVNTLQQMELTAIDEKYAREIEAAHGNADAVARIEQQREAEKLSIQKKYADLQFAVKVSQIVASTAVAIMQGYAQLGPIAGSVAAAMLAVTGAAQVAIANAERQKVKRMTPTGTGGGTPVRVASGREDGGYIDVEREQDGRRYRAAFEPNRRGYVNRPTVIVGEGANAREWVASNAALSNPTVAPIIAALDAHQRAGTIAHADMREVLRTVGRESGGYIGGSANATPSPATDNRMLDKIFAILDDLHSNGVKADVYLDEFEAQQARKRETEDITTR